MQANLGMNMQEPFLYTIFQIQQYLKLYFCKCWNIHISLGHAGEILFQKFWQTFAKLKFQYNYFKKMLKKNLIYNEA